MLKITPEHYAKLKSLFVQVEPLSKYTIQHLEEVYTKDHASGAIKAKDINVRLRWDLFACIKQEARLKLIDELYTYLNDDHIDSALKQIINEIKVRKPILVKFAHEDSGWCRVYYKSGKLWFCIMDDEWYACSRDGEPEGLVDLARFEMFIV